MALRTRTTAVTSTPVRISTVTPTGRTVNMLSVLVYNPTGVAATLDVTDGSGGAVLGTLSVGPYAESVLEWNQSQRLGNVQATAGNAIYAATRAAVAGGVEVILEHGRV